MLIPPPGYTLRPEFVRVKYGVFQDTIGPDTYTKFIQLRCTFSLHRHQTRVLNPLRDTCFGQPHHPRHRSQLPWPGLPTHNSTRPTALGGPSRSMLQVALGICPPIQNVELLWVLSLPQSRRPAAFMCARNQESKRAKRGTIGKECAWRGMHMESVTPGADKHGDLYTPSGLHVSELGSR